MTSQVVRVLGCELRTLTVEMHSMGLMLRYLTNPMLAQIPHLLLATHTGTITGIKSDAMQFYSQAFEPEAAAF